MKIKFAVALLSLSGEPLRQPDTAGPVTLGEVAVEALLRPSAEGDGQAKYKRYALARKIDGGEEVELRVEEVALLKQLIGELFAPLVVGRAWDLLEGEAE